MSCVATDDCIIPRPSARTMALMHNVNRSSVLFLNTAKIKPNSDEHNQLMLTVRALHKEYLHPWKYVEEQPPGLVDIVIAQARRTLPWLGRYEDSWPARVYLKRYVDMRRPHLQCTRYDRGKGLASGALPPCRASPRTKQYHSGPKEIPLVDDCGPVNNLCDNDTAVKDFLSSLIPSLEHRIDAFVELGIKDRKSLESFLSWPQAIQTEFLNEGQGVLQLTCFEKKNLLLGCSPLMQRVLLKSLRT